jgi:hypothetical protein
MCFRVKKETTFCYWPSIAINIDLLLQSILTYCYQYWSFIAINVDLLLSIFIFYCNQYWSSIAINVDLLLLSILIFYCNKYWPFLQSILTFIIINIELLLLSILTFLQSILTFYCNQYFLSVWLFVVPDEDHASWKMRHSVFNISRNLVTIAEELLEESNVCGGGERGWCFGQCGQRPPTGRTAEGQGTE